MRGHRIRLGKKACTYFVSSSSTLLKILSYVIFDIITKQQDNGYLPCTNTPFASNAELVAVIVVLLLIVVVKAVMMVMPTKYCSLLHS